MNKRLMQFAGLTVAALLALPAMGDSDRNNRYKWETVINNNDLIPPLFVRNFNSYNQPSVNTHGVVVMRARSRGGPPLGPATHGIYVRDMSAPESEVIHILDRTCLLYTSDAADDRRGV